MHENLRIQLQDLTPLMDKSFMRFQKLLHSFFTLDTRGVIQYFIRHTYAGIPFM